MGSVKTTYRFSKNLDESVLSWFDVQFPPSSFHGRIHIGRMKDDGFGVLKLFSGERESVRDFLENMHVSEKIDYYITANTVNGVERSLEGLFSLDNIVLDIDCHDDGDEGWKEMIFPLLWRFKHDEIVPLPSSIVRTGRGVQFWWHIRPVYVKCRPYFEEVRDFLIERIKEFLDEYSEFAAFKVDSVSSHNLVGYYRLPGTVNTKAGAQVKFEILRTEEYLLQDMTAWVTLEKAQQPEKAPPQPIAPADDFSGQYLPSDIRLLRNYHTFGFFRMRQLIQLRILRDNDIGEETRNNLCFMAYNAMLPALGHEKAFEKLHDFNEGFKEPLTEKELENVICSARDKKGYRYSNEKMIEFLDVGKEEQRAIGLWKPVEPYNPMTRVAAHPSRRAAARTAKEDRDAKVLALAEKGCKGTAIAQEVGIDRDTVAAILKRNGFSRNKKIMEMLDSGMTVQEICEKTGLCSKTIKKIEKGKNAEKMTYI